jgi:hypothetical protein
MTQEPVTRFAVTSPFEPTVAMAVLLLLHVTFLFVAPLGATVAVNVEVAAFLSASVTLFSVTPVTATTTVTVETAVNPPSVVRTVMRAVPALTPVTSPLPDTVATAGVALVHVTALFDAPLGKTVATN